MELVIFSPVVLNHWPLVTHFPRMASRCLRCNVIVVILSMPPNVCWYAVTLYSEYGHVWHVVPHLLQTHQGAQALALILLSILEEQTKKRARFSDRSQWHETGTSMIRGGIPPKRAGSWHRHRQAMVIIAIRRKENSITCLRYPVSSGIMTWGYGTVKLATPIT